MYPFFSWCGGKKEEKAIVTRLTECSSDWSRRPLPPPLLLLSGYDIVLLREAIWKGEASVLIGGQGTRWRRRCSLLASSSRAFFSCSPHVDDEDDDVLSSRLSFRASNRRDQNGECSSPSRSFSLFLCISSTAYTARIPRTPRPHIHAAVVAGKSA